MAKKVRKKTAHQLRQSNQEQYDKFNVEPTALEDGTIVRSRLEALWITELQGCEHFKCIECVQVPLWIQGSYGKFLSNYKPDIVIENEQGRVFVELKPTTKMALEDDRQKRALELNPLYKFMVIGGYPYQKRGVTVRLLIGAQEKVYKNISVCDVLKFLGCGCHD